MCRGRSSSVILYLQKQLRVWLIWAQGISRAKELRTAEAEALVIGPSSEIMCLFCSVFHLPAHTEAQFFPDQEFLGAEKRQCAARWTGLAEYSHSSSPCLKSLKMVSQKSPPTNLCTTQPHSGPS